LSPDTYDLATPLKVENDILASCPRQPEGIIEFPIGEESGVTGDGGAVEP
jgi:hypothetical protein